MNEAARGTFTDADWILWIVDASEEPTPDDLSIAETIKKLNLAERAVVALNKVDRLRGKKRENPAAAFQDILPAATFVEISAQTGHGCSELLKTLVERLPEGPRYYDPDQITDMYEREIARDLIREALLNNLDDEIPHSIAIRLDEFTDRSPTQSYIQATLLLDREAHKSIVIGKNGTMLKKIGSDARVEIEKMIDRKVFLELKVKVMKNWRNNAAVLKTLGYSSDRGK